MDLQAEARAHRIGQKMEVRVFRLITQTNIEEEMLSKASHKKNMDEKIIKAGNFHNQSNQKDRNQKLQEILKMEREEEDQKNEVPDDEQINEMLARSEEEKKLFDEMDLQRYNLENREGKLKEIGEKLKIPTSQLGKINYRLIQEFEVPDWVKLETKPEENINFEGAEGSRRARKVVSYKEEDYEGYNYFDDDDSGDDVDL